VKDQSLQFQNVWIGASYAESGTSAGKVSGKDNDPAK